MITVNFSIHVKCQSWKHFLLENKRFSESFHLNTVKLMAMEMLFKWMIKGCIWSLKIAFPPLNKFNSAVSTRLADAQHFSQQSHARLHEYGSVGTMVQFYDYLDVCNTLKPYLRGSLLFVGEMRPEKFLPFLQTSQGSWTAGRPTPPPLPLLPASGSAAASAMRQGRAFRTNPPFPWQCVCSAF